MVATLDQRPPYNWPAFLMFLMTTAVTATVVPLVRHPAWLPRCGLDLVRAAPRRQRHGDHLRLSPPVRACHLRGASGCSRWPICCSARWRCRTARCCGAPVTAMHHRYIDDPERDPYCARRGFWFSHIGWMLRNYPSGEPDLSTGHGPAARSAGDVAASPLPADGAGHEFRAAAADRLGERATSWACSCWPACCGWS